MPDGWDLARNHWWKRRIGWRCCDEAPRDAGRAADRRRRDRKPRSRRPLETAPSGRAHWTLRPWRPRWWTRHRRSCHRKIGRRLQKSTCSRIAASASGSPPKANGAFVAAMRDVLAVYMSPHDPERPCCAWMRHQSPTALRDSRAGPADADRPADGSPTTTSGTDRLIAVRALDVKAGTIVVKCRIHTGQRSCASSSTKSRRNVPADLDFPVVMDNYGTLEQNNPQLARQASLYQCFSRRHRRQDQPSRTLLRTTP